jgi:excisionase family DNA binding protein
MAIIDTKTAAEKLGISLRQVQTLIQQGKLPATKFGRDLAINEEDLKLVAIRKRGRPKKEKEADLKLVEPKKRGRPSKA